MQANKCSPKFVTMQHGGARGVATIEATEATASPKNFLPSSVVAALHRTTYNKPLRLLSIPS